MPSDHPDTPAETEDGREADELEWTLEGTVDGTPCHTGVIVRSGPGIRVSSSRERVVVVPKSTREAALSRAREAEAERDELRRTLREVLKRWNGWLFPPESDIGRARSLCARDGD